jgi:hypothetical protein
MRSMRSLLLVASATLAFGVVAPIALAASTPNPLHMIKDCGSFTGVTPSYCTITVSNLEAVPAGSRIWYMGPVLTNSYFLSSNVTLDAGHGSKATGYCIFEAATSKGLCTFWEGTGKLAGFTSVVDVTIDAAGLWHFDGMYYFSDQPKPPDTSTEAPPPARPHVHWRLTL